MIVLWTMDSVVESGFERGAHPEGRVAPSAVVEDLYVFEDAAGQFDAGAPRRTVRRFNSHPSLRSSQPGCQESRNDDEFRALLQSIAFPSRRSRGVTGLGAVVAPVRLRIVLLGGADGGVAVGVVSEAEPVCWIGEVGAVGIEIVDFVVSVCLWVSVDAVLRHG